MSRIAGISTPIYDLDGAFILRNIRYNESELKALSRRINKVATLDGAVAIEDRGYSDGDRSFEFSVSYSLELYNFMLRLIKVYDLVVLTTDEGAYSVAPSQFRVDPKEELRLFFEVKEDLSV